jgi:hypothetical protein
LISSPTLDFQNGDWPKINDILKAKLNSESPVIRICMQEQFIDKVDKVINIITDIFHKNLDELKPSAMVDQKTDELEEGTKRAQK